jgi:hypothetical protein
LISANSSSASAAASACPFFLASAKAFSVSSAAF